MHISYTAHNSKVSTSSSNLIEYLDKENELNNNLEGVRTQESFFDTNYSSLNINQDLKTNDIINQLDNNRGSQKLSSSNFFMINVSPSFEELKHMEKIADDELKKRGIVENKNKATSILYKEQKEQLMKMQLKLYTKDLMTEYAKNFDREIYINENKLPNDNEKKILNLETDKKFKEFLNEKNIVSEPKIESKPNELKEWISLNNINEISQNNKSTLIEIDLKEKGKANVFVPTATLQLQNNGSYKLPKNLYFEKEKEVISKNTLKEINFNYKDTSNPYKTKKENVLNFEKKDERFKEPLSFSINENDIIKKGDKYFVSEHLLAEKSKYSIEKGIEKEYGNEKEKIYISLATEKGFDLSKRPLTEKDLLWYGKIETTRSYKHTDKSVKHNKELFKEIAIELKRGEKTNSHNLELLNSKLLKDKITGDIIKEGNVKGGNQYHSHVVVSRHDKTMLNPRNKISLSPLSNARESNMNNGAKVGFDRKVFAEKAEKVFDQKFEYQREKTKSFSHYNEQSKLLRTSGKKVGNEGKQFLMKHTGLNAIKQNISPVQSIKQEIGIAKIPTSLPKSFTELGIKIAKKIISKGFEY